MAQGPPVSGSKGLAPGLCWVTLQGLRGRRRQVDQELVVGCGGGDGWVVGLDEVGDEEGRDGKFLLLPGEPHLITTVPCQGVEVREEGGLLHVLPQEGVQGGESRLVPWTDISC